MTGGFEEGIATRVTFRDADEAEWSATREEHAADAAMPTSIGGFAIVRRVGAGGMGTVFEARQERPDRVVALKVMRAGVGSKQLLMRFEREADVLARLSHPNIAKVYATGTHAPSRDAAATPGSDWFGPVPFLALEFVPGASSITSFAITRRLSLADRVRLFLVACDAIDYGHRQGVLHRDVKPDNLLVDSEGRLKVIDFGVARITDPDHPDEAQIALTEQGQLLGTVQYMSPEQCAADPSRLDARTDVYSLGVVLYELLTNRLPYDVRSLAVHEAIRVVLASEPMPPSHRDPSFDRDLQTVLMKALSKTPEDRYDSARSLADDLDRWLRGEPITARPQSRVRRLHRFALQNRALTFVGFALLLVSLCSVGAIAALHSRFDREREARIGAERLAEEKSRIAEHALAQVEALRGRLRSIFLDDSATARAPDAGVEVASAKETLDRLEPLTAGDAHASIVFADSYALIGDLYERADAGAEDQRRAVWRRSLVLMRKAVANDARTVVEAVGPARTERVRSIEVATAPLQGFVWRVPQREGELLAKLGHATEARISLTAARDLCARYYAEKSGDPADAEVRGDLVGLSRALERLHREAGNVHAADACAADRAAIESGVERMPHCVGAFAPDCKIEGSLPPEPVLPPVPIPALPGRQGNLRDGDGSRIESRR